MQNDPLGYQDSMNMYQGFNQNPVNYVDPMGLATVVTMGSGLGYSGNLEAQERIRQMQLNVVDSLIVSYELLGVRGMGALQAVGGALMVKAGLGMTAGSGGLLSPIGFFFVVKGLDYMYAGAQSMVTGKVANTFTHQLGAATAGMFTDNQETQYLAGVATDLGTDLFLGGAAI
ncbi:MAG: hypothetical protein GY757_53605, partial [bacterium]|nr:hypothetical protein [bacterium]